MYDIISHTEKTKFKFYFDSLVSAIIMMYKQLSEGKEVARDRLIE